MRKIFSKIRDFGRRMFARYDAAWPNWNTRSWRWKTYQDARFDVNKSTRQEIQSKHRDWVCNNGICLRIRDLFLQFSVGWEGLKCTPNASGDGAEEWNMVRKGSFDSWAENPEISTYQTLGQLTRQWSG